MNYARTVCAAGRFWSIQFPEFLQPGGGKSRNVKCDGLTIRFLLYLRELNVPGRDPRCIVSYAVSSFAEFSWGSSWMPMSPKRCENRCSDFSGCELFSRSAACLRDIRCAPVALTLKYRIATKRGRDHQACWAHNFSLLSDSTLSRGMAARLAKPDVIRMLLFGLACGFLCAPIACGAPQSTRARLCIFRMRERKVARIIQRAHRRHFSSLRVWHSTRLPVLLPVRTHPSSSWSVVPVPVSRSRETSQLREQQRPAQAAIV